MRYDAMKTENENSELSGKIASGIRKIKTDSKIRQTPIIKSESLANLISGFIIK